MYQKTLLLTTVTALHVAAHKFGYGKEDGPSKWRGVCQTGKRQSPVDIRAFEIEVAPLDPLLFLNYELTGHIHLANNGHTVIGSGFETWGQERPHISGGGLNGTYQLSQFHFHWSQQNDTGSEHTIASLHYPGELHLVHIKKDPSPEEVNTIAVVAVFIRLDDHVGSLHSLKPYIQNIRMPKTELVVPGFSVNSLLPEHRENFYRYEGSLTTPGCDEAVVWTLMADPIMATPSQIRAFREVQFASGNPGHNWRPTQPLNGRKILFRPTITLRRTSGGVLLKPVSKVLLIIWLYGIYHIFLIF
ncbi:eukaryotic-type carbonic anhydrase [Loa loa]|uniref:Carbonic anhydrase n=1 Tax=Loa loa TaxID=7209 RepID=A0A1S0U6M4_LOALO|nr:eukaryotic-type carbonic anhydrase [Loa loa]EFO25163.2 eukaryotic-type carbonic anhydrase [Loa loa]